MPLHLLVVYCCYLLAVSATVDDIYRDVCILGAGAGGMSTAALLKDKGKSVVVIESDKEIGGACDTIYFTPPSPDAPSWIDIGVIYFLDTAAAKAAGVGNWTIDSVNFTKRFAGPNSIGSVFSNPKFYVDIAQKINYGQVYPGAPSTPDYLAALARYNAFLNQYPWLADYSYPDTIPNELLISFTEFVKQYNLTALVSLFQGFVIESQGPSDSLPLIYALAQLNQIILRLVEVANSGFVVNNGCASIYAGIKTYLNSDGKENVIINATTLFVERPRAAHSKLPSIVTGYNSYNLEVYTYLCKNIVIAFPQTLKKLKFVDLDAREKALFSTVEYSYYFDGIINVTGGNVTETGLGFGVQNVNISAFLGQPTFPTVPNLRRVLNYGPAAVLFISPTPSTEAEAFPLVEACLANLSSTGVLTSTLEFVNLHQQRPVPAITTLNVTNNFFSQAAAIQGYRNTYWVGALFSTAATFAVWNHAAKLVDQFFS